MNTSNLPKISVITPSYNQGQFLEQTILSVINQNYPNLEYIIIDGGSTDNSVDIIKKYEKHLTYWVSEKDNGQSHAINKGLSFCTGELFNWVNSDDYLAENVLFEIGRLYYEGHKTIVGNVMNFNQTRQELHIQKNITADDLLLQNASWHQPGFWLDLSQLRSVLPFKEELHFVFDAELMIRYFHKYPAVHFVNKPLAYFRMHDGSKTTSLPQKMLHEFDKIRDNFLNSEFAYLKPVWEKKVRDRNWILFIDAAADDAQISKGRKIYNLLQGLVTNKNSSCNRYFISTLLKRVILK